jgi:adenosylhomocysteine nucleosidase
MSLAVGSSFCFHDINEAIYDNYFPFTSVFPADPEICRIIADIAADRAVVGKMASGDSFVNSAEQKKAIVEKCDPICVDMETAACAMVCYVNGVPFAAMKAISDLADDSSETDYSEFETVAADTSAQIIVKAVKAL